MRIYDFKCEDGHVEEHIVKSSEIDRHMCGCGKVGIRQLSAPPCILDGASGHFPGRAMKWEREHEQAAKRSDHNRHRFE